jgi:hypothetical protein
MSKKENAVQTAQVNNNQVETKDVAKSTEATKSVPEIKESIEELKAKLEEQLKTIERKNELAGRREKFLSTKKELRRINIYMKRDLTFESKNIKIVFKAPTNENSNYSDEVFSISNNDIIRKFIEILSFEIDSKVKEIETELIK